MKTKLFLLTTLLLGFLSPGAWGQSAAPYDAQGIEDARARITAERQQQTTRLDAEDNACLSRFSVTDCQNGVAQRRRAMLARLKRQEVKLNDAMRQERGREQRARLQEKAEDSAARSAEAAALPAPADRQAMQDEKVRNHPRPVLSNGATGAKTKTIEPVDAQALAEKRKAFEDKQKAVVTKRQERDKRLQEQGPAKIPLPLPP